MELNPCHLFRDNQIVYANRFVIVLLLIADHLLVLGLRLLSMFFENNHKQKIDDLVKNQVKPRDLIKVEEIKINEVCE